MSGRLSFPKAPTPSRAEPLTESGLLRKARALHIGRGALATLTGFGVLAFFWSPFARLGLVTDFGLGPTAILAADCISLLGLPVSITALLFIQAPIKELDLLDAQSDETRLAALRLIESNPDARALSLEAKAQGRSLRMLDFFAMRDFEKNRLSAREAKKTQARIRRIERRLRQQGQESSGSFKTGAPEPLTDSSSR